jgi:hypothetical protein
LEWRFVYDEGGEMWVQLVCICDVVSGCCFLDGTGREEVREEVDGVYPKLMH